MLQTFLPAFEAVVKDSKIRGIMCAYNSVNGVPLCANKLLQEQLRDRMGFKGIVITDCGAIGMMTGNHHWKHTDGTPYTPVEATAAAMAAGTDLNCGSAYGNDLRQAWSESRVNLAMLKQAAGRAVYLVRPSLCAPLLITGVCSFLKSEYLSNATCIILSDLSGLLHCYYRYGWMELGLFEDTKEAAADTRRKYPMSIVDSPPHRALAKQAAVRLPVRIAASLS